MNIDVVFLPKDLAEAHMVGRAVVVFDVLRATTSMAAAMAAGISEIRIFDDLDRASHAAHAHLAPRLLCGEKHCLKPPGFDLGNSPGDFSASRHAGCTAFMCTTNGTRAIVAARRARVLLVGAIVNAQAVARHLTGLDLDVTLLCAGTQGQIAVEDVIGAGAVLDALDAMAPLQNMPDEVIAAMQLFRLSREDLRGAMAAGEGGRNVLAVNLGADIDYASRLNSLDVVGIVDDNPLAVRRVSV